MCGHLMLSNVKHYLNNYNHTTVPITGKYVHREEKINPIESVRIRHSCFADKQEGFNL